MRVGVLIGQIKQIGGVGIAAFEEVRQLKKLGYNAELLVLMERPNFSQEDFTKDLKIRYLSREFPSLFKKSFKLPFFSFFSSFHLTSPFAVTQVLKKREYDIIVCHETYNCFSALRLSNKNNIPFIAYIWDPFSYILPRVYSSSIIRFGFPILKPLARYFDRLFVRHSLVTLTGCTAHVKMLEKISNKKNIRVLYPGCYPSESIPEKREEYILSLTKWDIGKNPNFLLDILRRLENKKAKMVIAGNWVQDSLRIEFIKKAKEYDLLERIEISGRVSEENKNKLLSGARLLVHPIFEAFGMFGLEAAAHGCPIIIPEGSGVTGIFTHGVHGFFPKEGDLDGYVKYIDLLLDDENIAWKMGYEAWKVAKEYTWENHARNLVKIIEESKKVLYR